MPLKSNAEIANPGEAGLDLNMKAQIVNALMINQNLAKNIATASKKSKLNAIKKNKYLASTLMNLPASVVIDDAAEVVGLQANGKCR